MIDKNSVIRKSLQSDSYYKRHRQKARKDVRGPSTEHSQGSTKNRRKRYPIPPFQHIPLSFMNSLTPKGRARLREDSLNLQKRDEHSYKRKRTASRTKPSNRNIYFETGEDKMSNLYFKDVHPTSHTSKLKTRINLSQE